MTGRKVNPLSIRGIIEGAEREQERLDQERELELVACRGRRRAGACPDKPPVSENRHTHYGPGQR